MIVQIAYEYDKSFNRTTAYDARVVARRNNRDSQYTDDGLDRLVQADRGEKPSRRWALMGSWVRKARVWLLATAGSLLIGACSVIASYAAARADVGHRVRTLDSTATVSLRGAWLSVSHGLVVEFDIHGHSELQAAYWYGSPWRDVVLEK